MTRLLLFFATAPSPFRGDDILGDEARELGELLATRKFLGGVTDKTGGKGNSISFLVRWGHLERLD